MKLGNVADALKMASTEAANDEQAATVVRTPEEVKERMKQAAAVAMGEYIDYFTEPIWEDEGSDNEEDEEEDPGNEN